MTWALTVLAVLLLGGVAVVAAGRGGPLAPTEPDDPAPGVPDTGPLGADDLRRVRFPLALRGYRMADVDALLDRLAAEREPAPTDDPPGPPARGGPPAA